MQATLADLSEDLLQKVLEYVPDVQTLVVRASIALVNRTFAAAIRGQRTVVFTSSNVTATSRNLSLEALFSLSTTLQHVTRLQLHQVHRGMFEHMVQTVGCCRQLEILEVWLESDVFGTELAGSQDMAFYLWYLLSNSPTAGFKRIQKHLRHMVVCSANCVYLDLYMPGGMASCNNLLACIIAGSMAVLPTITALNHEDLWSKAHVQHSTALIIAMQSSEEMLQRLPALKWLDIGSQHLKAPFRGIVRGYLLQSSMETFCKASAVHCRGLAQPCPASAMWARPLHSIKTWVSSPKFSEESKLLRHIAPKLEVLKLIINETSESQVMVGLGLALQSIIVTCVGTGVQVVLRGNPQKLGFLHVCAGSITMSKDLYDTLQAQQTEGLVYGRHDCHRSSNKVYIKTTMTENIVLKYGVCQPQDTCYNSTV